MGKKDLDVLNYSEVYASEWDEFIKTSRNGTFMNTRKFLSYHKRRKFKDASLMFFKKDRLISVFPAAIVDDGQTIYSHPGCTYGGIIINNECKIRDVDEIIKYLFYYTNLESDGKMVIKTPPKYYHKHPCEEIDFMLYKYCFRRKLDLSSSIYLPEMIRMDKNCKLAIRKSSKAGVYVRRTNDFKSYWKILENNLLVKHDTKPTHSLDEIQHLYSMFPHNIRLICAYKGEEMLGGCVLFITDRVVHTQYICMNYEYQKLRPLNMVMDFLIKYSLRKKKQYFNFGVSTEHFGETVNWGLFRFKESFGARGVISEKWLLE